MIRIAAVADLHSTLHDESTLAARFRGINERADLLLLPGDLTDNGNLEEAGTLVAGLSGVKIPILAVLGNHDYTSRIAEDLMKYLRENGIHVLDGDSASFRIGSETIGIAGTRGFRGGFEPHMLTDTTEPESEVWVRLAEAEAAKLGAALGSLQTHIRVAMLHYAPIPGTVRGEDPETYAFYGCSRLCEPVDRFGADIVVHGHAHHGTYRGATPAGIPVYNVSAKVTGVPYAIIEVGE